MLYKIKKYGNFYLSKGLYVDNCDQERLFSSSRIKGYTNLKEHEDNLRLIGSISHKIGILEIVIRNKIDALLCKIDTQWVNRWMQFLGRNKNDSRGVFISSQSLGFWVKITDFYKIHTQIFDEVFLDHLELNKYFEKNPHKFSKTESTKNQKSHKTRIMRHHKAQAILRLFLHLRNRAFHFENLYKMNKKGPRLSIKIANENGGSAIISICPDKIESFLDDLLISFDEGLVSYANSDTKI